MGFLQEPELVFNDFLLGGGRANHQLVNQDSGNTEWWTPRGIVAVAAELMGGIDLDPACSDEAWTYHDRHAVEYYTSNGLSKPWSGNIWLNHPFSRDGNPKWIRRLYDSHLLGHTRQSCNTCFAAVNARWFHPLLRFPQFFFAERVHYIDPSTLQPARGVTKDSVFTWIHPKSMTYNEACKMLQSTMEKHGYRGWAK